MENAAKVVSAADEVADLLRREIIEGRLQPGSALRQDELAARFGKSRIPIREALRALQAEGLVTYSVNRGAVVTEVSPEKVLEMLEVRIALETHALRLAIPRMIPEEIEEARRILSDYDQAGAAEEWTDMNARFHEALCAPCECDRLMELVRENYVHFNRYARISVSEIAGKEVPQKEHYRLLELCEEGNTAGAVKQLEQHIRGTQKLLRAEIRRRASKR